MISEALRTSLYPVGLLSSLFFGTRAIWQWMSSEKQGYTYCGKGFWAISLAGNLSLIIHAILQVQFLLACAQVANAFISHRNLEFLRKKNPSDVKLKFLFFILSLMLLFLLFSQENEWNRSRVFPWNEGESNLIGWQWMFTGALGLSLANCRFWYQWACLERTGKSELNKTFWSLSLIGGILSCLYFWRVKDPIMALNFGTATIPFIRNLLLPSRKPEPNTGEQFS